MDSANASALTSVLISGAGGDSLAAVAGVELDSEGGDFVDGDFEVGLLCENCKSNFGGSLRIIGLACFDLAPREPEPLPLLDGFDDMMMEGNVVTIS